MLLSVVDDLLGAEPGAWFCTGWPLFWLWPAWTGWTGWTGLWVWLGLVDGLEASMLLPMLLPSCRRLMCRTTAVALKACWRWEGNRTRSRDVMKLKGSVCQRELIMSFHHGKTKIL